MGSSGVTIIVANTVFTGTRTLRPGAICIEGGRILATTTPDEARTRFPGARVADYGDAFACPGFHDAHMHFFHSALYASDLAESYLGESEADCVARLAPLAQRRPDGWLLTQGWREYRWNPAVLPNKHSLDAAYPDRPVAMYSGDAHTLWLNSCALERLGIGPESVPPAGGSYDKDENGELTGIIREAAAMDLMPRIIDGFTTEELAGAYVDFIATLNARGITSICDMSLMAQPGLDFVRDDLYTALEQTGELTVRVHMFPTLLDSLERLKRMQAEYTGPRLRACGFKQFFDGVSSQHTAWLAEPYSNARFDGDCGRPTVDPASMRSMVMSAAAEVYAVRIHTIGDEAIHQALDIFEEAIGAYGQPAHGRHCLGHLENFQPDDIARMGKLGVVASVQPPHITLDPGGPERDLGPERVKYMWPFATLEATGAQLAFGTDSPVVESDPMAVLYTAVTRKDAATQMPEGGWLPEERIGIEAALRASTYGPAVTCGREHELGTLEEGMLADIAILDRDLLSEHVERNPELILSTQAVATYIGGDRVFER